MTVMHDLCMSVVPCSCFVIRMVLRENIIPLGKESLSWLHQ